MRKVESVHTFVRKGETNLLHTTQKKERRLDCVTGRDVFCIECVFEIPSGHLALNSSLLKVIFALCEMG